jgi:hypothetical protein
VERQKVPGRKECLTLKKLENLHKRPKKEKKKQHTSLEKSTMQGNVQSRGVGVARPAFQFKVLARCHRPRKLSQQINNVQAAKAWHFLL